MDIITDVSLPCRGRPALVLAAVAASGVLYLSIFDTLLLLRWLGTFAILFTAFNRIVSYSSPSVRLLPATCIFQICHALCTVMTAPAPSLSSINGSQCIVQRERSIAGLLDHCWLPECRY